MAPKLHHIGPDRHGSLPKLHFDGPNPLSPTTRADVLAWCFAARGDADVVDVIEMARTAILASLLRRSIDTARALRSTDDLLNAFDLAASDIHDLVREFGYDPTSAEETARICRGVLAERISATVDDLRTAPPAVPALQLLRRILLTQAFVIAIANVGRIRGEPERLLAIAQSVMDDADDETRAVLQPITTKLKKAIDRQ